MANCFITGIAPTQDVVELESMLGAIAELDRSKLTVITKAERTPDHDRSFLNFIHAGGAHIDSDTMGRIGDRGASLIMSSGGTGVPGIAATTENLGVLPESHGLQSVGMLPIPADEADNYNDALDDGRTVIAYPCDVADPSPLEAAMRTAGVRKVKTFAVR